MSKISKSEREEALARLREWVKPGDTIYTTLESVSRSGMSRVIRLIKFENNEPSYLSYNAYLAGVGSGFDRKRDGIKVGGCGMDMGFALVHELSYVLFRAGYECLGAKCPSSDHNNARCKCGASGYDHSDGRTLGNYGAMPDGSCKKFRRHDPRGAGVTHKDGYAFSHRWL